MASSTGCAGNFGLPQRISGSGVHPQHDLVLVCNHNAGPCNLCHGPLAGLPSYYSCVHCVYNVHVACIFAGVQAQPQHVGVGASVQQQPQHAFGVGPSVQAPQAARRGLGTLIAGSAIGAMVTEIVKGIIHGDDY